jgi:membrane protease YdiL (CAAX protease family)
MFGILLLLIIVLLAIGVVTTIGLFSDEVDIHFAVPLTFLSVAAILIAWVFNASKCEMN